MTYITSQGAKIYYEVAYGNKPTLLMLHGNGNSVKNWHSLSYVDFLKEHFNLVLMDCCGYGKSDKPHDPARYTPEAITQDCISVLDDAGLDKVHIYGGSRGANITLLMAKYFPQRFLSYTILDAEIYENTAHKSFLELLKSNRQKGMISVVEEIESWLDRPFPQSIRDDYIANDVDVMIAASAMSYPDLSDVLKDNPAPCCLISSNSEPWSEQMPQFHRENPAYEFHEFKDLSHAELYWGAKTIAPIIINFIKKHSQ